MRRSSRCARLKVRNGSFSLSTECWTVKCNVPFTPSERWARTCIVMPRDHSRSYRLALRHFPASLGVSWGAAAASPGGPASEGCLPAVSSAVRVRLGAGITPN